MDPKDIVRRGYDALSYRYRGDSEQPEQYATWLTQLRERVPPGGAILDLGCGNGVPLARDLAASGYQVSGVDLSAVQVERARQLVPAARFLHADATQVRFPPSSLDAVISLYALIHLPLDEQPSLLGRIGGWLRPGGWFLATTGHRAWTGTEDGWLGGDAPMWWSHADAATYRSWFQQAGLAITSEELVTESTGAHPLFWVHRPPTPRPATEPPGCGPPASTASRTCDGGAPPQEPGRRVPGSSVDGGLSGGQAARACS
ncbi:MAG TPA: methyltransferase domain-containing protein, partial [Actinomycetes bacterium]|nr:methyltransferase domain-containing protein [Actinomycetes bacterium]